jgi:hypothetical protein
LSKHVIKNIEIKTGRYKCENDYIINLSTVIKEVMQDSSSGYASVNGLEMYYEIYGKGAPLVLIHGGGSTIQTSFGRVSLQKKDKLLQLNCRDMDTHLI